MRSFTTVIVILAATLSLATAFEDFMVLITRGDDENEADCTPVVSEEICDVIEGCVADATGKHLHPTRKNNGRRMLKTSTSVSRQLGCDSWCNLACQIQGFCVNTCSNCGERRLEEEFLRSNADQSLRRELTPEEDGNIKAHCKQAAMKYARDSGNSCLGSHSAIDVIVKTSD